MLTADFMRIRRPLVFVLALLAFAFGRLTGAHLHLCFDGTEPPLTLHTADSAHVDHHAGETHHEDLDVEPIGDLLAKSAQLVMLAVFAAAVLLLALLAPPWRLAVADRESLRPPHPPPRFLRPPLRAPPV
jgi:hypothetical protein